MSKKKNKKQKTEVRQNLASVMVVAPNTGAVSIDTGFETLRPTAKGQRALDAIKRKKSKLTISASANLEAEALPPKPEFDIQPMSELLDKLEDMVKDGKYGKGIDAVKDDVVKAFLVYYDGLEISDEKYKSVNGMVKKLISICKSYYEYDDKNREILANVTYDGVLAKFLSNGNNEPIGIIPKGLKTQKRVAIKYPTLHNNVDKAYVIGADDKVPAGVKETDSIEAFLMRTYKALNMGPATEMELELSPKIDGVSVNGTIARDMLIDPQTRGDENESISIMGLHGLDIGGITTDDPFGIQYELFVTEKDRVKASEYLKLDRPYVSCRHAASGIMHRLATAEDDGLLEFVSLYPIAAEGPTGIYVEVMDYLENFGIVPKDMIERKIVKGDMKDLLKQIRKHFDKLAAKREELSYAIDGMVITVVDDEYRKTLGRTDRTNKFQIALKFDPANQTAEVSGIHLDSGKKGYRTIQVDLKHPVFLDGVRYDHVPVLSLNLFEKLELREGSKVNVHRVGDVIPSITVVDGGHGSKIKTPKKCPVCGEPLLVRNKKLYCSNLGCKDNIIGKFTHFFEKMGMDGYGEAFAETLVEKLKCKTLSDLIKLTKDDFKDAKVTDKIAMEFNDALKKGVSGHYDYEILGAMGIPGVGPARARMALKVVPFNEIPAVRDRSIEFIIALHGIMNQMDVAEYGATEKQTMDLIEDIRQLLTLNPKITSKFDENPIRVGHTGGKLDDEIIKLCQDRGMMIVDGNSFDVLITPNKDRESGKMDTAKKKNLPIFLPDDFKTFYYWQNHFASYLK